MQIPPLLLVFAVFLRPSLAQPISTDAPVPPLQWINLTPHISGTSPAPVKDAMMAYYEAGRTVVVFGGESAARLPTQVTSLLNLDTLAWSSPSPPPNQVAVPPARSLAIAGIDYAANYRADLVIYGGKGADGPLSDLWSFNFLGSFWVQGTIETSGGSPSPRWGAVGGTNPLGSNNSAVTNQLFMAGGTDGSQAFPLSDVWRLEISGSSSPNVADVRGVWTKLSTNQLAGKVGQAGTVVPPSRLVAYGGCDTASGANATCAKQDSHVITIPSAGTSAQWTTPAPCPGPRYGATLVPNLNRASSAFGSQVFMIGGDTDKTLFPDSYGTARGEIGILDVDQGTWSRIIPAGDPGSPPTSTPTYPSSRSGAAIVTFPSSVIGGAGIAASDILMFGGQETESGRYLNELWLLRAYNAVITSTNQTSWSGYGDGQLRSGPTASGTGVTVQYLTECVSAVTPTPTTSSTSTPLPSASQPPAILIPMPFEASILHKVLSPVSIALFFPAILLHRFSSPVLHAPMTAEPRKALAMLAWLIGLSGYVVGVVGFALSITSTSRNVPIAKRSFSEDAFLKTNHSKAGFALFLALYAALPIFALLMWYTRKSKEDEGIATDHGRGDSHGSGATPVAGREKQSPERFSLGERSSIHEQATPDENQPTTGSRKSKATSKLKLLPSSWKGPRTSVEAPEEPAPTSGFEVLNRPSTARTSPVPRSQSHPQNLNELSWLQRRRRISEIDGLTSLTPDFSPPTSRRDSYPLMPSYLPPSTPVVPSPPTPPPKSDALLHFLFHSLLLATSILCLVILWSRARTLFYVFLAYSVVFYVALFALAWYGYPRNSWLTIWASRLRGDGQFTFPSSPAAPLPAPSPAPEQLSQSTSNSPYIHQPPYRRVPREEELAARHARSDGSEDDDDDEDDDVGQARMESEMGRRVVTIVTSSVPKPKLFIANAS